MPKASSGKGVIGTFGKNYNCYGNIIPVVVIVIPTLAIVIPAKAEIHYKTKITGLIRIYTGMM